MPDQAKDRDDDDDVGKRKRNGKPEMQDPETMEE